MGSINNSLQFGGTDSADYGILLAGDGTFNAPERDVEAVNIPGRNGDLLIDRGRFKNITVEYTAYSYATDMATFRQQLGDFRNALTSQTGYQRLSDTFHPDEYRLGTFISGFEAEPLHYNTLAEISLEFDCKPQRFLKSGDEQVSVESGETLTNPTPFEALPLIEVNGAGTLTVGNISVTVTGTTDQTIFIDCELMDAYTVSGGAIVSANDKINLNESAFPSLSAGETGITFTGLTEVKITPRWWRL